MFLKVFIYLRKTQKLHWIYFEGEHVMDIRYYQYKVILYTINNFFVEVFYHHTKGCIERVEVMDKNSNRLKFYADQVHLPM